MENFKGTKGKWYVNHSILDSHIIGNSGSVAISSNECERGWIAEAKSGHINNGMSRDEWLANAALISAAPDLLAAIVNAMPHIMDCADSKTKKQAERAVKKALTIIKK